MSIPTHAILSNQGKVRIIGYLAPSHFRVLTARDTTRLVHRDRLTML